MYGHKCREPKIHPLGRIAFFSYSKFTFKKPIKETSFFLIMVICFYLHNLGWVNLRGRRNGRYKEIFFPLETTVNPKPSAPRARVVISVWAWMCVGCDKKVISIFYIYKYVDEGFVLIRKWFLNLSPIFRLEVKITLWNLR